MSPHMQRAIWSLGSFRNPWPPSLPVVCLDCSDAFSQDCPNSGERMALDLGLKGHPRQRFIDYQRMILGKQLLGRARQLTPPAPGWSFYQYTLVKESLDDGTIGLNRSLGMGKCSLHMERLRGRETDRV